MSEKPWARARRPVTADAEPAAYLTRFTDVWGQEAVLERVKESIVFVDDPESIEKRGGHVPAGILLWGPPGTGKTLMAEAVAGETGKPLVFVDPGAFNAVFMGVGILKVKALFRKLRKLAVRYGGVIVFFDKADSLGNRGLSQQGGIFGGKHGSGLSLFSATPGCDGSSYPVRGHHVAVAPPAPGRGQPAAHRARAAVIRDRVKAMGMGGGRGGGMGTLQALLTELSGLKKPRGFMNRVVRRVLGMRPKPPPLYRITTVMATNLP